MNHPKADEESRILFQKKIDFYKSENRTISYIDESGFAHDMPRTHGYSDIGGRCYGSSDWNAKGRENVIGALVGKEVIACGIYNTNIDSDVFNHWVEHILIPELPYKSVIIMDNATFHKSQRTKNLLHDSGYIIEFLPPYSPDLNPIERKWSQAKALRRKYHRSTFEVFQKYIL